MEREKHTSAGSAGTSRDGPEAHGRPEGRPEVLGRPEADNHDFSNKVLIGTEQPSAIPSHIL